MSQQPLLPSKHYFNLKGEVAEALLYQLASRTFLSDWCYLRPKLPDGKELCDLLVVFGSTAIIWQAKSLKLPKTGTLHTADVDKNLRQLSGARRQLFDLKTTIMLDNSRRKPEQFDPSTIKEVFLISVLLGDTPDYQTLARSVKEHHCHVFTREFTEIILNELDTVADFSGYLREKERMRARVSSLLLMGGEEELLGYYLLNDRSLAKLEGHKAEFLDAGIWEDLQRRPEYQAKKKADVISYVWDAIIERAHTGDSPEYERIARELARLTRFERRFLSQCFCDAHNKACESASPKDIFKRAFTAGNMTVCFLFAGDDVSRENRRTLLENLCFVARGKFRQQSMVLGVATEMVIREESSLDYCLLDIPQWGPEQECEMKRIQDVEKTLTMATMHEISFSEYPEVRESTG